MPSIFLVDHMYSSTSKTPTKTEKRKREVSTPTGVTPKQPAKVGVLTVSVSFLYHIAGDTHLKKGLTSTACVLYVHLCKNVLCHYLTIRCFDNVI